MVCHSTLFASLFFIIQIMLFYRGKGLVTDNVLNATRVLGCGLLVNSEGHENSRENGVALVELLGNLLALGVEGDVSVTVLLR